MKKLTVLFLVCLFTNVAVISAYDHPIAPQIDGSCKSCESHKEKECDVDGCIDHISAFSEESGFGNILELFNSANGLNLETADTFVLTFEEQLTKSGDSILLLKPNTFLFQCPGQYCVEFSGCVQARPNEDILENLVIVFLVNGEILEPINPRPVFTGTIPQSPMDRINCFFKSAVIQVPDEVSCGNPFSFQVAFTGIDLEPLSDDITWQNIHYSIKITRLTGPNCK